MPFLPSRPLSAFIPYACSFCISKQSYGTDRTSGAAEANRLYIKRISFVFKDNSILIGFRNTFVYVGLGTLLNMAFTIMGAYTLSRKGLLLKVPL